MAKYEVTIVVESEEMPTSEMFLKPFTALSISAREYSPRTIQNSLWLSNDNRNFIKLLEWEEILVARETTFQLPYGTSHVRVRCQLIPR
jgi:hypothetical protein